MFQTDFHVHIFFKMVANAGFSFESSNARLKSAYRQITQATARSNVCRTDACLLHNLLLFSRLVGLLRDLCYTSMCCRHTMSQSGPMILALTWQKLPERKARKVYTTDMQPRSRPKQGHCRARCKPHPQFWHTCQQQHFYPCPR